MPWFRLRFEVADADADAAEMLLTALGAVSVTLTSAGDGVILEPDPGTTPRWHKCRLEALFSLPVDFGAVSRQVRAADFSVGELEADFLEDDDWANRWRQHALQTCFADRLWLAPRDAQLELPPHAALLRLEPGLAFGSGSHPTTRLCLDWLARADLGGRRLIDFGCGSGVLALAALLLGAREVVAVDHDPQALLATRDNAAYNLLDDERLTVGLPALLDGVGCVDVVVANILAGPLIELAPRLTALVAPGGSLLLSGVLCDQGDDVMAAYPDFAFAEPAALADDHDAEWLALAAVRRSNSTRMP